MHIAMAVGENRLYFLWTHFNSEKEIQYRNQFQHTILQIENIFLLSAAINFLVAIRSYQPWTQNWSPNIPNIEN